MKLLRFIGLGCILFCYSFIFNNDPLPSFINLQTYKYPDVSVILNTGYPFDNLSESMAVGDINGDGYDDIIASVSEYIWIDPIGEAHIFFGSRSGFSDTTDISISTDNNLKIIGLNAIASFGFNISTGDINNDGYDDVILTTGNTWGILEQAKAFIVFGSESIASFNQIDINFNNDNTLTITSGIEGDTSENPRREFFSLISDLNGDDYDDVILGTHRDLGDTVDTSLGEVFIIWGSSDLADIDTLDLTDNNTDLLYIKDRDYGSHFGNSLASEDINNDGINDLIVGAPNYSRHNSTTRDGPLYIFFGKQSLSDVDTIETTLNRDQYFRIYYNSQPGYENLGITLVASDLNNDGCGDIIAGIYDESIEDPGRVVSNYIIWGKTDFQPGDSLIFQDGQEHITKISGGIMIEPNHASITFNSTGTGDIDGDGNLDIFIGSSSSDTENGTQSGKLIILQDENISSDLNSIDLLIDSIQITEVIGAFAYDNIAHVVISGDVNGDNFDDIIISVSDRLGKIYILYGKDRSTSVKEENNPETPSVFELGQNYPNPFNPVTTIKYYLPISTHVTLTVYNILGQEVARIVDSYMPAGYHSVKWDASKVASGTYIYKIVAGEFIDVKKMVVIK